MELRSCIENRRSIRKYQEKEVSNDLVYEIIKEATHAPSGHNRQPWRFKILSNDEKNRIANALEDKYKDDSKSTAPFTAGVIRGLPLLVVVYLSEEVSGLARDIDILSIGSIIDEIILLATEQDLGTLWIADTNNVVDEIKDITGVDLESVSCIGFGYKNQEPNKRPRKEIEDIIL